jgi:hypothetical protein
MDKIFTGYGWTQMSGASPVRRYVAFARSPRSGSYVPQRRFRAVATPWPQGSYTGGLVGSVVAGTRINNKITKPAPDDDGRRPRPR